MEGSANSSSYQELRGGTKAASDMHQLVNPFFYRPRMTSLDWVKVRRPAVCGHIPDT